MVRGMVGSEQRVLIDIGAQIRRRGNRCRSRHSSRSRAGPVEAQQTSSEYPFDFRRMSGPLCPLLFPLPPTNYVQD